MKSNFLKLGMLIAVVVGMAACNKSIENNDEEKLVENERQIEKYIADSALTATRDSSGLYYVVRKANPTAKTPKIGDKVNIKFNGYLLNGTKVVSSENDKSLPFLYPFGTGLGYVLAGMELSINRMRVGEVNTIFMTFPFAFGSYAQGNIPAHSALKMNIELVSSRTEVEQIDDFLTKKQFTVSERTSDNLVIVRTNTVTGDTLGVGKSVNVKYTLKLLDDTKVQESTYSITTGTNGAIAGFDRAVRKMRKGEKIITVFPSSLGYGKQLINGTVSIPPYSPLQYELEVL
ncbi:FKBP-type peptidyl-prolyl cis-trans isomerase [Dyadobacter diqingensis]|uniref:FKBP-type peptidyl-prolyl cis-trans isomerase n=1 Tax=Dyadobacter diqingensis TaxID=2938121 RepID=UPI0020C4139F|nr:FKBP-type peptidyl-prolyl cis-trans isomerase [Dyadobacter diqingensis]